jgi:hypothetical protein
MKNLDGAALGLLCGIFYLPVILFMGWEYGGLTRVLTLTVVASAITIAIMFALTRWFPPNKVWIYPMTFSLPTVLVGLVAASGAVFIVIGVGIATFLVGIATCRASLRTTM